MLWAMGVLKVMGDKGCLQTDEEEIRHAAWARHVIEREGSLVRGLRGLRGVGRLLAESTRGRLGRGRGCGWWLARGG